MRSVDVLYIDGDEALEEALAAAREAMAEAGSKLPLRAVRVESRERALEEKFLGSPTLRVRGRDVEIFRHTDLRYGYQSRLYRRADGTWTRVPPKDMILLALARYG
jgi:hypothetical protein